MRKELQIATALAALLAAPVLAQNTPPAAPTRGHSVGCDLNNAKRKALYG